MAERVASSKISSPAPSSEMSADKRLADGIRALKERHKEAKKQLKLQHALDLVEEEAEARRREDRCNYLLGQALRRDRSEAATTLASAYADQLTHPSDRKLFGLSPLPVNEAKGADSLLENLEKPGKNEGEQGVEDALSRAATDGLSALSDVGEEIKQAEEITLPDPMIVISGSHPTRHEQGAEGAAGEAFGGVSRGAKDDDANATTSDADERDDVASAGLDVKNRHAHSDRNGKEDLSSASITSPENVDSWEEGTKIQTTDLTDMEQASNLASLARPSFGPQVFLSQAELKTQIDETGAKRSKLADKRWIATASTPEQAERLVALKLEPYKPK